MEGGAEARLTLVSAPAGFGKTTVLAWLHTHPQRTADRPADRPRAVLSHNNGAHPTAVRDPVSVALIGLGHSLWREQRTTKTLPGSVSSQLDPTRAK